MKITALLGSPKRNGITSSIAGEIIRGAEENLHDCAVIFLSDLNIQDCTGCMQCRQNEACVIRDDIALIEEAVKKSDMLILASPTHWGNLSGIMLRVIERLFGFLILERTMGFPVKRQGNGKKVILVSACSTPFPFHWLFNQTRAVFSRFKEICTYSGISIVKTIAIPGTLAMKEIPQKYLTRAREIGRKLK
jgi:multimeric flavodoxin WrbA